MGFQGKKVFVACHDEGGLRGYCGSDDVIVVLIAAHPADIWQIGHHVRQRRKTLAPSFCLVLAMAVGAGQTRIDQRAAGFLDEDRRKTQPVTASSP